MDVPLSDQKKPTASQLPEPLDSWAIALKIGLLVGGLSGVLVGLAYVGFAFAGPQKYFQDNLVMAAVFGLGAGVFGGLLAGAIGATSMRSIKVSVKVPDPAEFPDRLRETMSRISYAPVTESPTFFTYQPQTGFHFSWTEIAVEVVDSKAWIVGPLPVVDQLVTRLQE